MSLPRTSSHPVDSIFLNRWSPRSFDASLLPKEDLMTMFEAARWAPSANNIQPWRFVYSQRNNAQWETFISLLDPFNASWAKEASALVFLLSDKLVINPETKAQKISNYNSFDTGAAWAQFALQASKMDYSAHAMAGIHFDQISQKLNIPERYKVEIAIAVGKRSAPSNLSEKLAARETPSQRLALEDITFEGGFSHD